MPNSTDNRTCEQDISFIDSRSGAQSARAVCKNGEEVLIHSIYDPKREAITLVDQLKASNGDAFIVMGLGLGYHVKELALRFPDSAIIVIEFADSLKERAGKIFPEFLDPESKIQICAMDKAQEELRKFFLANPNSKICNFHHMPCIKLHPQAYTKTIKNMLGIVSTLGQELLTTGRAQQAKRLFESAAELTPQDWQFRFLIGRACMMCHNYEDAAGNWQAAAKLCSDTQTRAQVELELARLYERLKDNDPRFVANAFNKVIETAPGSPSAEYAQNTLKRIYLSPVYDRIVQALPTIMQIEVTNICNLNCIMCPREQMKRPKGFMDMELFKDLIVRARKNSMLRLIKLYFMGEPTLHKDLCEMIRFARKAGVPSVGIQTNGETLTPEYIDELLLSGLHDIGISFEKSTCDEYSKVRRGSDFEKVTKNISLLARRRRELGSKTMLMLSAVDMGESAEEKKAFIKHWSSIVDHVSFLDYTAHENTSSLRTPEKPLTSAPKPICKEPFEKMLVLWNGDVAPCCIDFDGRATVGNVKDQTLSELWLGAKMTGLREAIITGNYSANSLCRNCPLNFANQTDTNSKIETNQGEEQ